MPGCTLPPVRRGRCDAHAPPPFDGNAERRHTLGVPVGPAAVALRRRIRRRARGRCENCRAQLGRGRGTVDHRLPVALGGTSDPANLWLLCDDCERAKTAADLAAIRAIDRQLARR